MEDKVQLRNRQEKRVGRTGSGSTNIRESLLIGAAKENKEVKRRKIAGKSAEDDSREYLLPAREALLPQQLNGPLRPGERLDFRRCYVPNYEN